VVGNPANTNRLITMKNAPSIPRENFSCLTRLDHNRAKHQVAEKAHVSPNAVKKVTIWGNHSSTQFPDLSHATISGKPAGELINDQHWVQNDFVATVQQRGAAVIKARGNSSAFSAAKAIVDHMHDWVLGTADGDWVSMGVPADGSYGISDEVIYSYPVTIHNGKYSIVQGLSVSDFAREKMNTTLAELKSEAEIATNLTDTK